MWRIGKLDERAITLTEMILSSARNDKQMLGIYGKGGVDPEVRGPCARRALMAY